MTEPDGIILPTLFWETMVCDLTKYDAQIAAFVKLMHGSVEDAANSAAMGRMAPATVTEFRRFAAIALQCCRWFVADGPEDEIRNAIKDLAGSL